MEWRPAGWSVCLPLLIFACTIKSRSSIQAPARPGGPGKRAVKWLCCGGGCYDNCLQLNIQELKQLADQTYAEQRRWPTADVALVEISWSCLQRTCTPLSTASRPSNTHKWTRRISTLILWLRNSLRHSRGCWETNQLHRHHWRVCYVDGERRFLTFSNSVY